MFDAEYRKFIEEIYLVPIRAAIVVDDDYPTLDELLTDGAPSKTEIHKSQLKNILKFCRSQKPTPWLVDVHNGKIPTVPDERKTATYLNHSDLLILDYHLEGDSGSEKSIGILRSLASNGHFNLVVVYTGAEISQTVREIGLSLACQPVGFSLHNGKKTAITKKIEDWDELAPDVFSALKECFDELAFLKVIANGKINWADLQQFPELNALSQLVEAKPTQITLSFDEIIQFLTYEKIREFESKMANKSFGHVTVGESPTINWIRADSIFVTVISKKKEPEDIRELLLDALQHWNPQPQRLIMSKMRNELDQEGVLAETSALSNRHLQAGWLREAIDADQNKRRTNVRRNVERNWESLGGRIGIGVIEFADRLCAFLSTCEENTLSQRFDERGAWSEQSKVHIELNCHVCSKAVEGHHLATGHVLSVANEYWLCLTPACDLEPDQGGNRGWKKKLGPWLPFKAVRLFESNMTLGLSVSTQANHLFLKIDSVPTAFSFSEIANTDQDSGNQSDASLKWEQWFAGQQGRLEERKIKIASIRGDVNSLSVDEKDAMVVAQLRYEYALNLTNRLGAHLSRVGLDFKSYSTKAAKK